MKDALIAQAERLVQKIQTSPSFDENEQAYLVMLVLSATADAIELTKAGASA